MKQETLALRKSIIKWLNNLLWLVFHPCILHILHCLLPLFLFLFKDFCMIRVYYLGIKAYYLLLERWLTWKVSILG